MSKSVSKKSRSSSKKSKKSCKFGKRKHKDTGLASHTPQPLAKKIRLEEDCRSRMNLCPDNDESIKKNEYYCVECKRVFKSKYALGGHKGRLHSKKRPDRVDGSLYRYNMLKGIY